MLGRLDSTVRGLLAGFAIAAASIVGAAQAAPGPGEPGVLIVTKVVDNQTQADLSGWPFPVTVTCGTTSTPVILTTSLAYQHVLSAGESCTAYENPASVALPDAERACPDGGTPHWLQEGYATQTAGQYTIVTITNTIECSKEGGKPLTVTKIVVTPPGAVAAGTQFVVGVSCEGNSIATLHIVGGQSISVNVPPGDCKVDEDLSQLPDAGKACPDGSAGHWTVTYQRPGDYVHAGDTVVITNTLDCGSTDRGSLTIIKHVVNHTNSSMILAGWTYPVTATCGVIPPLADGQSVTLSGLTNGTTCTVDETQPLPPPPFDPKACFGGVAAEWLTAAVSPAGAVPINGHVTVTVTNTLHCPDPRRPGSLTIIKQVVNQTNSNAIVAGWTYPITATCGTVPPLSDGQSFTLSGLTNGAYCTVDETQPLPPPPSDPQACPGGVAAEWLPATVTPAGTGFINGPTTVTVTNTLHCPDVPPPVGTGLTIQKTLTSDGVDTTAIDAGDFQVSVVCTNPSSVDIVTLTAAQGYQAALPNLPDGADCVVSEIVAQNPPLPAGQQWVATYPNGQNVHIGPVAHTFTFNNERVWNTSPAGYADLRIVKDLQLSGVPEPVPTPTLSFSINVTCTIGGVPVSGIPQPLMLTPSNVISYDATLGWSIFEASQDFDVPVGSVCSVDEPVLPQPTGTFALCQWNALSPQYYSRGYSTTSAQPIPDITLAVAQQTYTLTVDNRLSCPPVVVPAPEPTCKKGLILVDGSCVKPEPKPLTCKKGEVLVDGECVKPEPKPLTCKKGQVLVDGECVKPKTCKLPLVSDGQGGCTCAPGLEETKRGCVVPDTIFQLKLPGGGIGLGIGG